MFHLDFGGTSVRNSFNLEVERDLYRFGVLQHRNLSVKISCNYYLLREWTCKLHPSRPGIMNGSPVQSILFFQILCFIFYFFLSNDHFGQ